MRRRLLWCLVLVAVVPSAAAGASSARAASGIFVVHPDPRACPSPVCGGYWVALANRARTLCADGLLRPRCYVASAEDAAGGEGLSIPSAALAQGSLTLRATPDRGPLGALRVAQVSPAATRDAPTGAFVRIRDAGVRCVRRPCFSYRAQTLNFRLPAIRVSSVALGAPGSDPHARGLAEVALSSPQGLLAAGTFRTVADGGRIFLASQLYLRR